MRGGGWGREWGGAGPRARRGCLCPPTRSRPRGRKCSHATDHGEVNGHRLSVRGTPRADGTEPPNDRVPGGRFDAQTGPPSRT